MTPEQAYSKAGGTLTNGSIPAGFGLANGAPGKIDTTNNAPKVASSEVGVVSSQQGADTIQKKTTTLSNLTAPAATPVTGPGSPGYKASEDTTKTAPVTKVTLINPTTGQSSVFDDAELNKGNIQSLMQSGYQVSDTSGNLPSWLVSSTTGTTSTPQSKAQNDIDLAATNLKNLSDSLTKFTISDTDLAASVSNITAQFDQRIKDMQAINEARKASINTTGIRLGSQYAGGAGGNFGGIVSEEERQGVSRIADLESQKQQAISAAKTAATTQNWQVYSKQVDLAQKAYEDKITALKELNTATTAQNKIIADQLQHQQDADAKTKADFTKSINDILTNATKGGLTDPTKIQAIQNAPDLATAISLAGDSLQTGTGVVGEYLFYKQQAQNAGQTPVDFNTYQNIDANRKAKATTSASSGDTVSNLSSQLVDGLLAPSELAKRASGSGSYNDILVAADKYSMAKYGKHFNIAQADRDYKFAQRPQTQDTLNYLGSLVGSIDPETGQPTSGNLVDLLDKSNAITRTDFPALNSAKFYALMQTGDPQVVAYLTTVTEVSDQIAKILQGGGSGGGTSDAKLRQASALFNTGFSKAQVEATVKAIMPLLTNRAKSMVNDNPYLSDYADQFGFSGKPTTAQTIINQQKNDPLNLGAGASSSSNNNPLGI